MWSCLIIFMIPIYDLSSFENTCKSLTQMSLPTSQLVRYQKHSIIFGCNNSKKMLNAFLLWFLMIMLGHSDKVHFIGYTWMVEDAKKVLLRMNWNYGGQAHLMSHYKWPTLLLNTPMGLPSLLGYLIWKVNKFLDPQNKGLI